ncbi:MAG: [ribosomal protein S5]-alanine N-acetyltransferase [Candidatus Woesearchaeota archaeon]|nr:[ribosomal protein S5]-alanine N-acetyltransferase [Candidatus Woesearchaeota archaeon]
MEIKIIGDRIYLKEMNEVDAIKLHEHSKEPKLNEFSGPYQASDSIEKALEYINNSKKNILERKSYILGIYEKRTEELVGTIGFFDLDDKNKNGELGFWIAKNYWNKGYMTEAIKIMTNYIFTELGYHRISAHFHELNKAVGRILSKAGYEKEGELKEAIKSKEGKYYNEIIYGIVNPF